MQNLDWYHSLNLPKFTPPDIVFSIVWPVLYLMIFASAVILLKKNTAQNKGTAVILFLIQLILNFSWSMIFFGAKDIDGGLVVIFLIWIILAMTVFEFFKISKFSAILLSPYYLWITFALYLNFSIFWFNK